MLGCGTGSFLLMDQIDSSPSLMQLWIEANVCFVEPVLLVVAAARTPWFCAGAAQLDGCLRCWY